MKRETKIFNRSDIQSLMSLNEHIEIVEKAFRLYAEGNIIKPDLLHIDADQGEFHIKVGGLKFPRTYFGLKSNGGFFENKKKYGLPNIQGLILLHDGDNGSPLAIFESGDITIKRTGAATAVASKYLAQTNSDVVTICGCGIQGKIQLEALLKVRSIKNVFAYDTDHSIMEEYAREMGQKLNINILPTDNLKLALQESQICVTCTPSRKYFIKKEYIHEGMFISAVGADSPDKQELDPDIISMGTVVADVLSQCVNVGEIHHAIEKGFMQAKDVHAEIGEIIIGKKKGRSTKDEIITYDATGTALQDVAAAAFIYEKALKEGKGLTFEFPS